MRNKRPAKTKRGPRRVASRVVIVRDIENAHIPSTTIRRILTSIMHSERLSGTVQVIVVGNAIMRRLNRRYMGRDKTTDVLSFPFDSAMPGAESMAIVGEIYCNYSHCRKWTSANGGKLADELLRLAVHGCLHLAGYDHHKPDDSHQMSRAENRYLSQGGLIRTRVAKVRERDND